MLPRELVLFLKSRYEVTEARARGWGLLENGDLLREAEAAGFDVMMTADKNIRSQQNLKNRKIALVILGSPNWAHMEVYVERILTAIESATPGSVSEVNIPLPPKRR
jgi:hypothetical protein